MKEHETSITGIMGNVISKSTEFYNRHDTNILAYFLLWHSVYHIKSHQHVVHIHNESIQRAQISAKAEPVRMTS